MKKLTILLLVLYTSLCFSQSNYSNFWNELLSNNRENAGKELKKIKNNQTLEYLLSYEVLRKEQGRFKDNKEFLSNFLNQPDFEYYLYALWNEGFLFNSYLDKGFNDSNINKMREVAKSDISDISIKDALYYLESVLARKERNWDLYYSKNSDIKSLKNWQYCGVFENLNKSGLDRVYEPEINPISQQPFNAESNGKVNWYTSNNSKEAYQFFVNHSEYGVGVNYAQTFIDVENDETLILRIGSSSAFKIWLNDVQVFENTQDVITELNSYNVKLTIPKGNNRLLIKTADSDYLSYFIVTALNLQGKPNTNLKDSSIYAPYNKSTLEDLNVTILKNNFEEYFENKYSQNPDDIFNIYCLAKTYLRNSKYEEAKKILLPLLDKFPKSSFLKSLLIEVYTVEEDYTSLKEIKTNIEIDDPDYYLPIILKVIDYDELSRMSLSELQEFIVKLKKTVDLELLHVTADFYLNARKEDRQAIKKNLDELILSADGNAKLILTYAPLYATIFEDEDKTIKILESLNKSTYEETIVNKLAGYYDKQNKKEKVIKLLTSEYDQKKYDNYYLKTIINTLQTYHNYKESLKYIDQGLNNFPDSFMLQELKGDALFQIGKKEEAQTYYESSLSHNSSDKSLRNKIKDIKNEDNVLKTLVIENAYDLIKELRDKVKINNYGFNILYDNSTVELYSEGGGNYRNVFIYEITSDSGVENFKEYNLGLSGNYSIIKSEIVKKDASIIPADRSGSSLVFNGLEIGDVIYLDYENSFSKTGRFYKTYSDLFMLGSFHPNMQSSVKIITPKDFNLNYLTTKGNTKPKITRKEDLILYEWSKKDNPGLPQGEAYMPAEIDTAEYIHLSTIDSWNEISTWYSDLVRSKMEVNSTVEDVFNKLFPNGYKNIPEDERAKIIYNYMRETLTYSYVSFRQSGFVPQKPSKTIKTGLGDCKDFSTLFVTLAKKADLEANLVLVLTSDYGQNALVLPSTDFNHCIAKVKIDGKDQFLELTDKYLPYKSLPMSLRGALALEIPLETSGNKEYDLFRLSNLSRDLTTTKNEVELTINENEIKMLIQAEKEGHINSYYASIFSEPNKDIIKTSVKEDFDNKISDDFTLNSVSNIQRIDNDKIIKYTSELTIDKKINKIGSISVLQLPIVMNPYTSSIVNLEKREYEINYIDYEATDLYEVNYTINIPENKEFIEIPENVSLAFKKHNFSIKYNKLKNHKLRVEINATPSFENIKPQDYLEFKKFVQNVLEAQEAFIGFK